MAGKVVIGSRGSALALWQARAVAARLGVPSEIHTVKTSGDRFLDAPLAGGIEKGFFTKEIELKLLGGEIDLAVHSLKDLPTAEVDGLCVGACLERAPVSDLLLIHPAWHERGTGGPLRRGCRVGATSLRRQALVHACLSEAETAFLRGNVPTRIRKCRDGTCGAVILARAGVERLAPVLNPLVSYELDPGIWLPAPGQGVIAIQARSNDGETLKLLSRLDHRPTRDAAEIERTLLAKFEGGCHTAFGAWARMSDAHWKVLVGIECAPEGWQMTSFSGTLQQCRSLDPSNLPEFTGKPLGEADVLCHAVRISPSSV
jgi:hydroxymethylbilane synthase